MGCCDMSACLRIVALLYVELLSLPVQSNTPYTMQGVICVGVHFDSRNRDRQEHIQARHLKFPVPSSSFPPSDPETATVAHFWSCK